MRGTSELFLVEDPSTQRVRRYVRCHWYNFRDAVEGRRDADSLSEGKITEKWTLDEQTTRVKFREF